MKNQLQIHSYLGIVAIASLAFVAETTYFVTLQPSEVGLRDCVGFRSTFLP